MSNILKTSSIRRLFLLLFSHFPASPIGNQPSLPPRYLQSATFGVYLDQLRILAS
jgi:hypothetical protein